MISRAKTLTLSAEEVEQIASSEFEQVSKALTRGHEAITMVRHRPPFSLRNGTALELRDS
jgi:hypothetical protein